MIKRTICLLIIFAMCLSFAACSNSCSSTSSSNSVVSQVTSEGSDEGDDSGQDSSSSVGTAQDDEGASQSEGDDSSNSDSGSGSDNADDNSGSDSDSDTDGANNGSGSDNGGTTGIQTGTGSAQSGFAITTQPVSTSVAVGAPLTLSVSASGSGTLTYKWYTSLTNSYNGIELAGQTGSSVSINTANPFTQYYYCVITQVSTGATLTTNIAMASAVGSAPTPTPTPTPTPVPTSYGIWVTGIEVTPANAADVLGDGIVSYDAATNTLYIQANIERSAEQDLTGDPYKDAAIGASRDLKIESLGSSDLYIKNNNPTATTGLTRGIYVTGNLTIVSNQTMRVQLESNGSDGVYVTGNLSTSGDKNIYVNGGDGNESYIHGGKGIYCGGKIVVGNGLYGFGGYGAYDSSGNGGIGIDARISVETIASYNAIKGEGGDGGIKSGTRGMGGAGIKTPEIIDKGADSGTISGTAGSDNTGVDDIVYE